MGDTAYASDAARWAAVSTRDAAAEGLFLYCVKTTGIYCRPTCKARLARRANVEFYDSATEAQAAGYRACKRCKPELPQYVPEGDQMIERVRSVLENLPPGKPLPKLEDMAAQAGLTKYHFHRQFKKATGRTPREYGLSRQRLRQPPVAMPELDPLSEDSTASTPFMVVDPVATLSEYNTPSARSSDLAMDEWLHYETDAAMWPNGRSHDWYSTVGDVDITMATLESGALAKTPLDLELSGTQIHYSITETAHGVLTMAFENQKICRMELLRTLHEAAASLASCFPAPFYLLHPVDSLPVERKDPLEQRVFAVIGALGDPLEHTGENEEIIYSVSNHV